MKLVTYDDGKVGHVDGETVVGSATIASVARVAAPAVAG